jgi:hypothetical protein
MRKDMRTKWVVKQVEHSPAEYRSRRVKNSK